MKGIVFAAGLGTRLKPFTDHHPKALAPIGRQTALGIVIERLIHAGVDKIIVNVHHFADQVISWLAKQNYPVKIEISDESSLLLDTGGALAKIYRDSRIVADMSDDEPIIVHNADIITDFPIDQMLLSLDGADATILADPHRDTARKFLFDDDLWLRGWQNNKTDEIRPHTLDPTGLHQAAFDGVHCMTKRMLAKISKYCGTLHPFSITDCYIEACTADNSIRQYTPAQPFHWYDIGDAQRLATAQYAYENGLLKL